MNITGYLKDVLTSPTVRSAVVGLAADIGAIVGHKSLGPDVSTILGIVGGVLMAIPSWHANKTHQAKKLTTPSTKATLTGAGQGVPPS